MGNAVLVIITALCSGLIATAVTIWWQSKSQSKQNKQKIFTTLMSKRYDLTSEDGVDAMNMIDVVFYKSTKVRTVWKEFNEITNKPESELKPQLIKDKHLRLLEVMAEDIGYKEIKWENIKQYYLPIGLSERKKDESILRKVQIDANLAQLNQNKVSGDAARVSTQAELENQMLLKAIENPDGFIKMCEAAERIQNFGKLPGQKRTKQ